MVVTAVSPTAAAAIPEAWGPVEIVPNAIDVESYAPTVARVPARIAFLGRDDPRKGLDVLLEASREKAAAAIVVGSHGEGAVSAAFLGSTALKLLHHSEIPVLVVPRHDRK